MIAKIIEIVASILVVTISVILIADSFENFIPDSQKIKYCLDVLLCIGVIILLRHKK